MVDPSGAAVNIRVPEIGPLLAGKLLGLGLAPLRVDVRGERQLAQQRAELRVDLAQLLADSRSGAFADMDEADETLSAPGAQHLLGRLLAGWPAASTYRVNIGCSGSCKACNTGA